MENKYKFCDIHPNAKIGRNAVVGPFTHIAEDVEIGEGAVIGNSVSILSGTKIGKNCQIFPGAVVGSIPQDLKYKNEYTKLIIGDNVVIRECCTLNKGTIASGQTVIGNHVLLMAYVHVAHDCVIGNHCILANGVNLAGHIEIADYVIIGGMSAVHQFVKIGRHAMVGGGSLVRKDVPPYVRASREPLSFVGINSIGLKRRGYSLEDIRAIQDIYRLLFISKKNISEGINAIKLELPDTPYKTEILSFINTSDRGLMKGFKSLKT
jgi:UDP-N-acetylglucosamine acyltransferase